MFKGIITALVTPFSKGDIDLYSFGKLIEQQLADGINGFVVNGTTGESPTVTNKEKLELLAFAKKRVKAKVPIIAGVGSYSTAETITNALAAESVGVNAHLVVVPYYNKPPQRGLIEHFTAVADATHVPNILYNVPGRTITSLEMETIVELSAHPNIVGIKEASGDISFAKELRKRCGPNFSLLSGDDLTYEQFMDEAAGDGIISVVSHLLLPQMQARTLHLLSELVKLLFCEANPIPLKTALFLQGMLASPELRLPLVSLDAEKIKPLREAMICAGILK